MTLLIDDIQNAINRHSAENVSNTPDYVLATFLVRALAAFDNATNLRALHMEPPKHPEPSVVTDAMVSRFLSWRLPGTFWPDCYISFDRASADEYQSWPTGTNLLDASQARAMLEHVLGAQPDQAVIHLTPHEVQSGSTRVDWAEGLIRQLPETHDGRNSWLLNYGSDADERQAAWAERNPNSPLAHAINLGQVTGAAPDARPKPTPEAATTGETEPDKQTAHQFETKTYPGGTTATGLGPLPDKSPVDPIESEIQAKGLTAPRVTPADVEASIASEHYFTASDGVLGSQDPHIYDDIVNGRENDVLMPEPLDLLTFCVLVLRNGYTVTGQSACASPENFDAELGRKIARANAVDKIWPLMGYALRDRLAQGGAA